MACLHDERVRSANLPVSSYAPIARNLQSTLNPALKEKMKKKFGLTFVLAKQNLLFTKYPSIYELMECHGVIIL